MPGAEAPLWFASEADMKADFLATSLVLAALMFPAAALAQQADASSGDNAGTQENTPPSESKIYGDWTMECYDVASLSPCNIVQMAINKNNNRRILSLSLAYIPSSDAYALQIVAPLGPDLKKGVSLTAAGETIVQFKFRHCASDGCYIEDQLNASAVENLKKGSAATVSVFAYGDTKAVDIPLSFQGFSDALAEMNTLAKTKAAKPAPSSDKK
jgi:invasion protein IalB